MSVEAGGDTVWTPALWKHERHPPPPRQKRNSQHDRESKLGGRTEDILLDRHADVDGTESLQMAVVSGGKRSRRGVALQPRAAAPRPVVRRRPIAPAVTRRPRVGPQPPPRCQHFTAPLRRVVAVRVLVSLRRSGAGLDAISSAHGGAPGSGATGSRGGRRRGGRRWITCCFPPCLSGAPVTIASNDSGGPRKNVRLALRKIKERLRCGTAKAEVRRLAGPKNADAPQADSPSPVAVSNGVTVGGSMIRWRMPPSMSVPPPGAVPAPSSPVGGRQPQSWPPRMSVPLTKRRGGGDAPSA